MEESPKKEMESLSFENSAEEEEQTATVTTTTSPLPARNEQSERQTDSPQSTLIEKNPDIHWVEFDSRDQPIFPLSSIAQQLVPVLSRMR